MSQRPMMFCKNVTAGRRTPKDGAENSRKSEAFLASQVFLNHTGVSSRKLSIWIRQRSGRKFRTIRCPGRAGAGSRSDNLGRRLLLTWTVPARLFIPGKNRRSKSRRRDQDQWIGPMRGVGPIGIIWSIESW